MVRGDDVARIGPPAGGNRRDPGWRLSNRLTAQHRVTALVAPGSGAAWPPQGGCTVSGMKINLATVLAAEGVVNNAVSEMEGVTQRILAQAGLSEAAMRAPAGQITSS